jgi:hypothetical protein
VRRRLLLPTTFRAGRFATWLRDEVTWAAPLPNTPRATASNAAPMPTCAVNDDEDRSNDRDSADYNEGRSDANLDFVDDSTQRQATRPRAQSQMISTTWTWWGLGWWSVARQEGPYSVRAAGFDDAPAPADSELKATN